MKDKSKNIIKRILIVLLVLFFTVVAIISILIITNVRKPSGIGALKKAGSQWVSDDGNISFTVYHEMWVWYSSEDEDIIDEIWDQRYIGFGQMSDENGTVDISCIISDAKISMSIFGCSANYSDISYPDSVDITIKRISDTEVVATVTRIRDEANWFSYNVGDEIRLIQVNDVYGIDSSDYEFFVDAIEITNAASSDTEITIYKREEIADMLKDFEEQSNKDSAE